MTPDSTSRSPRPDDGGRAAGTEPPGLRERILSAAGALLVGEGYASLSMRRIAAEVGCTATSIYLHFENKDALVHALIEHGMEELHEALRQVVETEPDPRRRLAGLCRAYLDFGLANPKYYEVMFLLHPERMARYPQEKYRRARRNLEFFAEAITELGGADPTLSSVLVWCLLHGFLSLRLSGRLDAHLDPDRLADEAVSRVFQLIQPAPTSPSQP